MATDYKKLWGGALAEIELGVSRANFATWFKDTDIASEKNGTIFLSVPNTFVKEWLSSKYHKLILKVMHTMHPPVRNIEYIISAQPGKEKNLWGGGHPGAPDKIDQPGFNNLYIDKDANLNPKYTLDSFVIGSFNEVAYAAATAVTKNIGVAYNPLFIYGGVGLGKTHLLQAIGNKIKENEPGAKVYYMTSEKFANDFVSSMQNHSIHCFKEKYRNYKTLIIDDIQFFSKKLKIQEEFFHIFNSLYERNCQIIFSSDKPPKHIEGLEERLRSRCEGGMMIDIPKPEYESRLAILESKTKERGYLVDREVLEYVASAVQENIRELEGSLNSIMGQSRLKGRSLSLLEVKELIKKNTRPAKKVSSGKIIKTTAEFYGIKEKDLFEKTRRREVVKPRQVAMYLLRADTNTSYPFIGQKFGRRDHTTAIHAYKKIDNSIKKDEKLSREIEEIRSLLYEKDV